MRILLVNPPNCGRSIPEERFGIDAIKMIFRGEPLALEVIAGNLAGHEVRICDLKAEPAESLDQNLDQLKPEVVGLTGMTCEANTLLALARDIKKRSGALIVAGGHHVSCDPGFFNREGIDYLVVGIGKLSFRMLIDALAAGESGHGIHGVAPTTPSLPLRLTHRAFSSEDLVDEAAPRYDLVEQNRDRYIMSGVGGKMGFVVSAYGCTHGCSFCAVPNLTGGRYLSHSAAAVVRDMRLLEALPLIRLVDANTFGNIRLAEELAQAVRASGLKQKLVADVRADTVVRHPELFRLWKEVGLATVVIGFEEVSDRRLAAYNKMSQVETHVAALALLKELGIRVIGDFIVSPDYEDEDFEALENFVKSNPIDLPLPAVLTPIPGTPLYKQVRDRITVHDLDYYTFTNAVLPTRMAERRFYEMYARLLKKFTGHIEH
jgi:radical SAM superfamily enzyme YgiQ (UPF0313 family)